MQDSNPTNSTERRAGQYFSIYNVIPPRVGLLSWVCGLLSLLLVLVVPLVTGFGQSERAEKGQERTHVAQSTLSVPAWNVGEISRAHALYTNSCTECHTSPFARVASDNCLRCHKTVGQHADPVIAPAADLSGELCESCHREHKGQTLATRSSQDFCVGCHGDIRSHAVRTSLRNVRDFTDHPPFAPALFDAAAAVALSVPKPGDAAPNWQPWTSPANRARNLYFSHARHLNPPDTGEREIPGPGRRMVRLECSDCHHPDPGGRQMAAVDFEKSCRSCHRLTFEPSRPDWQLPHGQPALVFEQLVSFYGRQALEGEDAKPEGGPPPRPAKRETDKDALLAAARERAAATMQSSIKPSLCGTCHMLDQSSTDPSRWSVKPVRIPTNFFRRADFSHAKHATQDCTDCHGAAMRNGESPEDLLPEISVCRQCHTGIEGAPKKIASTCISCHQFHNPRLPLLKAQRARSN